MPSNFIIKVTKSSRVARSRSYSWRLREMGFGEKWLPNRGFLHLSSLYGVPFLPDPPSSTFQPDLFWCWCAPVIQEFSDKSDPNSPWLPAWVSSCGESPRRGWWLVTMEFPVPLTSSLCHTCPSICHTCHRCPTGEFQEPASYKPVQNQPHRALPTTQFCTETGGLPATQSLVFKIFPWLPASNSQIVLF